MEVSQKFLKEILYAWKEVLGIGLLKPTTIIAILVMKLYFRHHRKTDYIVHIININEERAEVEYGYSLSIIETKNLQKLKRLI